MEIKLFEAADKKKSFTFSSLPEKISGSLGTKYQTYDIISQGAVKVPKEQKWRKSHGMPFSSDRTERIWRL